MWVESSVMLKVGCSVQGGGWYVEWRIVCGMEGGVWDGGWCVGWRVVVGW